MTDQDQNKELLIPSYVIRNALLKDIIALTKFGVLLKSF